VEFEFVSLCFVSGFLVAVDLILFVYCDDVFAVSVNEAEAFYELFKKFSSMMA